MPRQEVDEVRARDLSGEAQATAARSILKASEQRTHVTRAEHAHTRRSSDVSEERNGA